MRRKLACGSTMAFAGALLLSACGGGASYSQAKFCDAAEETDELGDDVEAALDAGSASKLERAATKAVDSAKATLKLAPEAIKADMTIVVDKQAEFVELLETVDFELADVDQADLEDFLDDSAMDDASDEVDDFLLDECGIEPDEEAVADTVSPAETAAPTATVSEAGALITDHATFVEFAALGNGIELTDEQKSCATKELEERISIEDLRTFVDMDPADIPADKTAAVGIAFVTCGITFES